MECVTDIKYKFNSLFRVKLTTNHNASIKSNKSNKKRYEQNQKTKNDQSNKFRRDFVLIFYPYAWLF